MQFYWFHTDIIAFIIESLKNEEGKSLIMQ